jgi:hypothetical protein
MICPTCNTTLRQQARFCRNCGSAIEVYDDGGFDAPHSGASAEGEGSNAWWQKVNSIILPLGNEQPLSAADTGSAPPAPDPSSQASKDAQDDPGPRHTRLINSTEPPSQPRRPASNPDLSNRYTRPISSFSPTAPQDRAESIENAGSTPPVSSRPDQTPTPPSNQSNLRSTRQIARPENLPRSLPTGPPSEANETLPEYRAPSTFLKDRLRSQSSEPRQGEARQAPPNTPAERKPAESRQRPAVEPPVEPWPLPKARPRETPSSPAAEPPVEPWPLPKARPPQTATPPQPSKPAPTPANEPQPGNNSIKTAPSVVDQISKEKNEQARTSQPLKNPAPPIAQHSELRPDLRPDPKAEARPEIKPVVRPEVKPAPKPEIKPVVRPEVKPGLRPEAPAVATSWSEESREPNTLPLATFLLLAVVLVFSLAFFWLR